MAGEPENLVLELLRAIRGEIADIKSVMATKSDLADVRSELKADISSLRADVASDLLTMQAKSDAEHKATRDAVRAQVDGLRRQVFEYHSSVIGHGMLISELEARVRRMEEHLDLPPIGAN
jgi:DNA-binding FrmR family transcriptional regulator